MRIQLLAAESLGARSLSCVIHTKERKIAIDPGIALDKQRFGLPPHPMQINIANMLRKNIIKSINGCTDIVLSHFHGDHIPMPKPDQYQLSASSVIKILKNAKLWFKSGKNNSKQMTQRRYGLENLLKKKIPSAEGIKNDNMEFSKSYFHGKDNSNVGKVMMTRIEEKDEVFVHASDIQLLNREAIDKILDWNPTTLLVSGPPLYLFKDNLKLENLAMENAVILTKKIKTLIIDHHLLRSDSGISFLDKLAKKSSNKVICAADFLNQPRNLQEAWRKKTYQSHPINIK